MHLKELLKGACTLYHIKTSCLAASVFIHIVCLLHVAPPCLGFCACDSWWAQLRSSAHLDSITQLLLSEPSLSLSPPTVVGVCRLALCFLSRLLNWGFGDVCFSVPPRSIKQDPIAYAPMSQSVKWSQWNMYYVFSRLFHGCLVPFTLLLFTTISDVPLPTYPQTQLTHNSPHFVLVQFVNKRLSNFQLGQTSQFNFWLLPSVVLVQRCFSLLPF